MSGRCLKAMTEMKDSPSISIRRDHVFETLLDMYKDKKLCLHCYPFFTFEGEDFNGLKRDLYTMFWEKAYLMLFEGAAGSFIPMSTPEVTEEVLIILGRVASHGFVVSGVFPVHICKAFVLSSLCGPTAVTEDELVSSFLAYHTEKERIILERALAITTGPSFPEDVKEMILDILEPYNLRKMPTPSSLRAQLISVSRREFIQKVSWAALAFGQGLSDCHNMWQTVSKEYIDHLYSSMIPSTASVLALMNVDDEAQLTSGKKTVLSYLKRFIRNTDGITLRKTLRFVTGSDLITVDRIAIIFHSNVGTVPEIVAHTCSPSLDLPASGYFSYNYFQSQMTCILNSAEAWEFTVV